MQLSVDGLYSLSVNGLLPGSLIVSHTRYTVAGVLPADVPSYHSGTCVTRRSFFLFPSMYPCHQRVLPHQPAQITLQPMTLPIISICQAGPLSLLKLYNCKLRVEICYNFIAGAQKLSCWPKMTNCSGICMIAKPTSPQTVLREIRRVLDEKQPD